jgi:glycosyltransferase involved in cell wall biosynthesis
MRILLIDHGDYPFEVRIQKMCCTLVAAGHEVHLVCGNRAARPRSEIIECLRVHRMPALRGALASANSIIALPAFFNPMWLWLLHRVSALVRPDVIIARDLPMALVVSIYRFARKVPVIFDFAENYPAALAAWNSSEPRSLKSLFLRNVSAARLLERLCVRLPVQVIVVCEENARRLQRLGVPARRITIVSNTPTLDFASRAPLRSSGEGSALRLVYAGLVERFRGIDTCIRAMPLLRERGTRVALRIIGHGPDRPRLESLAQSLGVREMVEFMGRASYDELPRLLAECDIGVVPHLPNELVRTTLPNKLFECMAVGLPVIVSDVPPMARIVGQAGCGLVFTPGNAHSLADAVQRLADRDLRLRMGNIARQAVLERYNWSLDVQRLLRVLESVLSQAKRRHSRGAHSQERAAIVENYPWP